MRRKRITHHLMAAGQLAVDLAPVLALLTRASHPIAWIGAAALVAHRIYDHLDGDRPNLWPGTSFQQRTAILFAAAGAGAGYVRNSVNGVEYRVLEGVTFAAEPEWSRGPLGKDPDAIPEWLWENYGRSLLVSREGTEWLSLVAEPCVHEPPSERARSIAVESVKLRDSGARVGVLIDGEPGTGKSEALLYVAACLGGRTLRADLKTVDPKDVVGIASVMKPSAVILDDLDRGPTDGAIRAVDRLQSMGVAVLASSNDQGKICDALVRDGRIDDHHVFAAIEPDVLARLTVGLPPDLVAELGQHKVATVARFIQRRDALGHERALLKLRNTKPPSPPCTSTSTLAPSR